MYDVTESPRGCPVKKGDVLEYKERRCAVKEGNEQEKILCKRRKWSITEENGV